MTSARKNSLRLGGQHSRQPIGPTGREPGCEAGGCGTATAPADNGSGNAKQTLPDNLAYHVARDMTRDMTRDIARDIVRHQQRYQTQHTACHWGHSGKDQ